MLITVTDATFDALVLKAELPFVVDFWARFRAWRPGSASGCATPGR
ncbi:hypothetical protein ACQPZX_01190 [Actinoplanes sp. CA-142083]